jgi:hypothetical protein
LIAMIFIKEDLELTLHSYFAVAIIIVCVCIVVT